MNSKSTIQSLFGVWMARSTAFLLFLFLGQLGCTSPAERFINKQEDWLVSQNSPKNYSFKRIPTQIDLQLLDPETKAILGSYGSTIQSVSNEYGLDWRLVLAVIKQESRFAVDAESHKGATGLMQMMPSTVEEVGRKLEIEDMAHPMNNIRGGIYYLKKLYDLFEGTDESDRIQLTLAAYNAGIGRVYDAQELAAYLKDNPTKWQSVRDALPLLSKRYYTLHKNIWLQEKPKAGWFGNSRQTVAYVDKVMEYYDDYRLVLN